MARPKIDIWMPIFVGDYLRDTQNLTAEEHGVYFLLLMHYWQRKGEIGADIKRLSVVTRSTPETTKYILDNFFSLTDGNYKNKRSDIELEAAMSRSESARANINKRWNKNSNTTVDTPVIPPYNDGNTVDYTDDDTESIRNRYSSPSPLPIQIQEEVHTYLEVGGMGEGENEEKKCVPKKSNPKPKDQETTHVLDKNIDLMNEKEFPAQETELSAQIIPRKNGVSGTDNPPGKAVAKIKPEPDPLYQAIFQSFIGKAGAFTNYPKEAQAIKRIIKYCEQHAPRYTDGDKIKLAEKVITEYFELTQNGDRFWRGQPFTPSNLSAPGIFDRVLVEIGQSVNQEEYANEIPF
jgi:uncharacterized protein YdaU (DUF1376 family)